MVCHVTSNFQVSRQQQHPTKSRQTNGIRTDDSGALGAPRRHKRNLGRHRGPRIPNPRTPRDRNPPDTTKRALRRLAADASAKRRFAARPARLRENADRESDR